MTLEIHTHRVQTILDSGMELRVYRYNPFKGCMAWSNAPDLSYQPDNVKHENRIFHLYTQARRYMQDLSNDKQFRRKPAVKVMRSNPHHLMLKKALQ
jgi:hypothetical protein